MKRKFGSVLDERLVKRLRQRAAQEDRSINKVLEDALTGYLTGDPTERELRAGAVERLCSRPFKVSESEVRAILEEDYYDQ